MLNIPKKCILCPRKCGADRTLQTGFCGGGQNVKLARAALHMWEEPCISGTNGSGTVFFSGCSLQCCYCQNYKISADNYGKEVPQKRLSEIFMQLQNEGAHNINLVSASHYLPWVTDALDDVKCKLTIPVVYNTGGYETKEAIAALKGYADIFLTDIKYFSPQLSKEYSNAADYFEYAYAAAKQMIEQTGSPEFDENGIMKSGVIIRHLALPHESDDTKAVLDAVAHLPENSFLISIMSQYTPFYKAGEHKYLNRRISTYEYNKIINYAADLNLTSGFMQEKSSAKEEYTPEFDLAGI